MADRKRKKRATMSEVTLGRKEKERIRDLLEKCPSPEVLSIRPNSRASMAVYLEGWVAIDLANKIFGYDGWSSRFRSFTKEYTSEAHQGPSGARNEPKFSVAYSCICRVELKCGTFREDIGFGKSENMPSIAQAIEKAKKAAATDALKRTLRQFGNAIGNCCYNKKFGDLVGRYKRGQSKLVDFEALTNIELLKASDFESKILRHTESIEEEKAKGSGIRDKATSGERTGDRNLTVENDQSRKQTRCCASKELSNEQQKNIESPSLDEYDENSNLMSSDFEDYVSD